MNKINLFDEKVFKKIMEDQEDVDAGNNPQDRSDGNNQINTQKITGQGQ